MITKEWKRAVRVAALGATLPVCICATMITALQAQDNQALAHRTAVSRDADGALDVNEDAPQVKDDLFDGTEKFAAKAKESNEVNLDKSMLGLAAGKGGNKAELARKLDFVIVRNYEYNNEGDYNLADVEPYFKRLDAAGWKHIVRTREGKEMTDVCVKQDAEGMTKEMVIISAEPKELSFIHLKGNVNLNDMQNLGGVLGGAAGQGSGDAKLKKR